MAGELEVATCGEAESKPDGCASDGFTSACYCASDLCNGGPAGGAGNGPLTCNVGVKGPAGIAQKKCGADVASCKSTTREIKKKYSGSFMF